jgi:hypothetical protein
MTSIHLPIGGLVAVGFDPTERYLLVVTHSGRGVFDTHSWKRVARDHGLAYPDQGRAVGIGPIDDLVIPVVELDLDHPNRVTSPSGRIVVICESSGIEVVATNA